MEPISDEKSVYLSYFCYTDFGGRRLGAQLL